MDHFHSPVFSKRVNHLMEEHHIPGLAIALVEHETVASTGFGKASLDPPKPCTADTLFDVASTSKSLTAAAVALLVSDDEKFPEVQYDAKLADLLPGDFVMPSEEYTRGVTVEDMLSHRTGMPRHDHSYMSPRAAEPDDARSVTRNLRNLPVAAPLRSKHIYNNMMYTVATYLIEKKTGLSFSDFLENHLLQPLHMHSTSLQPARATAKGHGTRLATGYEWNKATQSHHGFPILDCPDSQGAGSIITSANDYIKWVKAMLHHEPPIADAVHAGLIRSRSLVNPDFEQLHPLTSPEVYAAGWEIYFYRGRMVVAHDGGVTGFGARLFFLPDLQFGGAIFANADDADAVATVLANELVDALLAVPGAERPDWRGVICDSDGDDEDAENEEEKVRQRLCPGIEGDQPLRTPLGAYTGDYWNAGYHTLTVQVRDGKLFVDATDRSMGYSLTFDHVCEQTKFVAHFSDFQEGGDDPLRADFRFEGDRVVEMGLVLDYVYDEFIWFRKQDEE